MRHQTALFTEHVFFVLRFRYQRVTLWSAIPKSRDALPNCAIHRTCIFCLEVSLSEGHPLVRYSQEPGCAIKLRYSPSMYFCLEARYQRLTVISSQIFQDDVNKWSVKRDSNPRPSGPKPDALPNCAIHRTCIFCLEVSLSEGHPLVRYTQEPGCATKLRYSPSMCFLS